MLNMQRSVVEIGLDKPFRLLHITDAHIDIIRAENKFEHTANFEEALAIAEQKGLTILCTGDNFRGVSAENLAYAAEKIDSERHLFLVGNHDFCGCPNNAGLDNPISQTVYAPAWLPHYKQNLFFDSRIIGGVNFVSLQNVYYTITYGQIQLLQREVAKGFPIVLCMHVPLFASEKAEQMMATWAPCGYMVNPPEQFLARYNERRRHEQEASEETKAAVAYIQSEPSIKAIIAGHIHENFDGFTDCGKRQITTAALKDGHAREITFV